MGRGIGPGRRKRGRGGGGSNLNQGGIEPIPSGGFSWIVGWGWESCGSFCFTPHAFTGPEEGRWRKLGMGNSQSVRYTSKITPTLLCAPPPHTHIHMREDYGAEERFSNRKPMNLRVCEYEQRSLCHYVRASAHRHAWQKETERPGTWIRLQIADDKIR